MAFRLTGIAKARFKRATPELRRAGGVMHQVAGAGELGKIDGT
jgi:hypothetical protein